MPKRTAIIIIVITILLGTGVLYFLLGGKVGENGLPIFSNPFGEAPGDITPITPGTEVPTTPGETGGEGRPLSSFLQISDTPVAGFVGVVKSGLTHVRYVERATGHIFDVNPSTLEKERIINTTSPRVYEAIFKADGSGFLAKTLLDGGDVVSTASVSLSSSTATTTGTTWSIQTTNLGTNIGEISLFPNNNLLYTSLDTGGISSSGFAGGNKRSVLALNFPVWRIQAISNTSALLTPKASAGVEGYAYTLNTNNGALTKILGPLNGLSALMNQTGTRVAFSHNSDGGGFSVMTLSNSSVQNILPLTLAEKCVWSRQNQEVLICGAPTSGLGANFPDSWYEGTTSYSDRIWRFNTLTGTAEIILDPTSTFSENVDVIKPSLSPDEDFLFFINKTDLTLWAIRLERN